MHNRGVLSVWVFGLGIIIASPVFAADVAGVYGEKCGMCHGLKGEGTPVAPAFKGNKFILASSADEIRKVILGGRTGSAKKFGNLRADMPGGLVSEAEADALVKYLKGDLQK